MWAVLILALVSCYQDFSERKVKNWLILVAIFYGLVQQDLMVQATQGVIAILFGFVLFLLRWWGPGDAKLFAAYAFLFPVDTITPTVPFFPSLDLLINAMVAPLVWYGIQLLHNTTPKQKRDAIAQLFSRKKYRMYLSLLIIIGIQLFFGLAIFEVVLTVAIFVLIDVALTLAQHVRFEYVAFAPWMALGVIITWVLGSSLPMWVLLHKI